MPAFLLSIFGVGRSVITAILSWLSRQSPATLLCIVLALLLVVDHGALLMAHRHERKVEGQVAKLKAADDAARAQAAKADAEITTLTKQLKDATDAQSRVIADDARSLRVSGPGKSRCAAVPAASSNGASAAKPDAAGPSLPPADSAAVPWDWLTTRAEEHDQLLNEVTAWRAWHDQVLKAWPKPVASAPTRKAGEP
jgi:hypothetical protein